MLYISRFVGKDSYGVADSDTGVETVVNLVALRKAVLDKGLDIKGVVVTKHSTVSWAEPTNWVREDNISVYQPPNTVTSRQIKLQTLRGIEIKTFGSMITAMTWNNSAITTPVTIRLSDFGTSCGDFILYDVRETYGTKVKLVLDDSIEITPDTFNLRFYEDMFVSMEKIGLILDIHELSDANAQKIYDCLWDGWSEDAPTFIRDFGRRKANIIPCGV